MPLVCEKNVDCSSHAMETEAALRIWHRTLSYNLQFTVVETATALTVLWFNRGHTSFEQVLQELGIFPSEELVRLSNASDQRRIRQMCAKLTAKASPIAAAW